MLLNVVTVNVSSADDTPIVSVTRSVASRRLNRSALTLRRRACIPAEALLRSRRCTLPQSLALTDRGRIQAAIFANDVPILKEHDALSVGGGGRIVCHQHDGLTLNIEFFEKSQHFSSAG